ncbi:VWA domain-containing protein [Nannocystis sp. ILAH1]|uniref:vWA domain-containing protein n=1 Tax=unclassified Nannocystis TaxID=2627009 RepID=UPI002271B505|nr:MULTISPECIES: VWA domain-containing protein [unclassified Nannocystis]MCY0987459.1 VWA domain-containing protein [Nannocystis sp. ILAH1]MCY1070746.1 VWA domain-containing protein [Nannocystis sp. RBIL2]
MSPAEALRDLAQDAEAKDVLTLFEEVVIAREDLLWLLVLVPLAAAAYIWAARQRRRGFASLGSPVLVERLVGSVNHASRVVAAVVSVLSVLLLCAGLLRVQYGGETTIVPATGLDIVLAVDYSKSMLARDVYPSRSERLAAELQRFLDEADRRGDRVGLVVFAGAARGLPVSRDARVLKLYLDKADPRTENPGGTAIGKALKLALTFLIDARRAAAAGPEGGPTKSFPTKDGKAVEDIPPSESDQVVILLTDGEDTVSRPLEVAAEAAKLGVRIYAVGIGSKSGEPIQKFDAEGNPDGFVTDEQGNYLMTRVDEATLKDIAKTTGGDYVLVEPDKFGLDRVAEWIRDLSKGQREDTVTAHREEGYAFLVVPALLLLALSLALPERKKGP